MPLPPLPENPPLRPPRVIGKARARRDEPGLPKAWTPVLDLNPHSFTPAPLPGYAWLELPNKLAHASRYHLEFWYDPPGVALTDQELALLRRIAAAEDRVMFRAEGRAVPAHLAFDHQVDVLRDLRKAGWIVLETWVAEPGNRGHADRRFCAAQAALTAAGREGLELIG